MIVDLACLAALALAAVLGAVSGAIRQLAAFAAAGIALALARALGPAAAALAQRWVGPGLAGPVGVAGAFVAAFLGLSILLGLLARAARAAGGLPAAIDRGAGALLGGAKAALVLWGVLSAAAAWGRPLPGPDLGLARSGLAAFAREHGAFRMLRAGEDAAMSPRARREAAAVEWSGRDE